ncbi:MAG TPA: vitamin K epoxide reductase family protein [Bryobacteraceae bacterium]|jgi:uncharacterized membrane protein|nr:vitamin K epoxide reductase family protein [Bryobacteraceae bacterium]
MRCRRGIIGASLVGMAAMGAVALLQTGILKRLPGAGKVTLSPEAFAWGVPDGVLSAASFATNLPIAAFGGEERPRWIAIVAAAKGAMESGVSLWYLRREKAWCPYCIAAASANFAICALTLPELRRACAHN